MITEAEMPHEVMQKRVNSHKCGDCGAQLIIAWGGSIGIDSYILRCSKDISHNTITDYKKPSKEVEEGLKIYRRIYGMDTKALMVMDKQTMLARVGQAKFPKDLTKVEATLMCEVAISYGFDPLMQELMIYQGNPYVTINGRYRKAQETGLFDGIDTRPASKDERTGRNAKDGDYLYRCEVWRKDASHPFVGWGRVLKKETYGDEHLPVVKDPDRQAEKRAEAMGLRKAFSMPIPIHSWEEAQEAIANVGGKVVDTSSGEIIEGEVVKEEAHEPTPAPAQANAPTPTAHWCEDHGCAFELKHGKYGEFYAHKIEETGKWCNEKKKKEAQSKQVEPAPAPVEDTVQDEPQEQSDFPKTTDDLKQVMDAHGWKATDFGQYCNRERKWNISDMNDLTQDRIIELIAHIEANPKS